MMPLDGTIITTKGWFIQISTGARDFRTMTTIDLFWPSSNRVFENHRDFLRGLHKHGYQVPYMVAAAVAQSINGMVFGTTVVSSTMYVTPERKACRYQKPATFRVRHHPEGILPSARIGSSE